MWYRIKNMHSDYWLMLMLVIIFVVASSLEFRWSQ